MKQLNDVLATWGYLGRIPKAPGTWGTLGGLLFIYLIFLNWHYYFGENISLWQYCSLTMGFFLLGVLSANKYDQDHKTHDSKKIVIDEVVGMMVTLIPLVWVFQNSDTPLYLSGFIQPIIGFVFFRFFDILKPWPISLADKNVKGGFGVMLDDVLAGIAAALCFTAIGYGYHAFIAVG